jgi:hypothetical protein
MGDVTGVYKGGEKNNSPTTVIPKPVRSVQGKSSVEGREAWRVTASAESPEPPHNGRHLLKNGLL